MPRTRTPKNAPQRPTVTDDEYQDLLAIRLGAMHGFEANPPTVTAEAKNQARAAVRNARKVRKAEAQVIADWNEYQAKLAAEAEAKKAARPKRARKPAAAKVEPEQAPEVTPEVTEPVLETA